MRFQWQLRTKQGRYSTTSNKAQYFAKHIWKFFQVKVETTNESQHLRQKDTIVYNWAMKKKILVMFNPNVDKWLSRVSLEQLGAALHVTVVYQSGTKWLLEPAL